MPRGLPAKYIREAMKKGGSRSEIMKRAWRLYKRSKGKTSSVKRTRKKRRGGKSKMAKKRRVRRPKLFRSMGLKGMLIAIAGLTGIKYLIRNYLPQASGYENSISLLGVGLVKRSVLPAGIAMLASDLITDAITPKGLFTLPQFVGESPSRGYDI